jgi:hypothetical protein
MVSQAGPPRVRKQALALPDLQVAFQGPGQAQVRLRKPARAAAGTTRRAA